MTAAAVSSQDDSIASSSSPAGPLPPPTDAVCLTPELVSTPESRDWGCSGSEVCGRLQSVVKYGYFRRKVDANLPIQIGKALG